MKVADARVSDGYERFLPEIQERFNDSLATGGGHLFTTTATGLFDLFLENIPAESRQHYTCNACRHFVNRFGGLAIIKEDGEFLPAMWRSAVVPAFFGAAVSAIEDKVSRSRVTGVFYSNKAEWGFPVTGKWHHLHVLPPMGSIYRGVTKTAGQYAAEKLEEFKMLLACLGKYPEKAVDQAITLLKTDSLYRSEKCLGAAMWFKSVHQKRSKTTNSQRRANLLWLAVASAPAGFCHINSSMIGTLLDDIVAGLKFDDISRRFADKMHPLRYQRPQAAPSSGNVAQAEKIISQTGAARSLERRFARIDEIETIWKPRKVEPKGAEETGGVFSHLKTKSSGPDIKTVEIPAVSITWEKFKRTVLPDADQIRFFVPRIDNFVAILTAEHEDAPPIFQWDSEDQRNPFSWYLYNNKSSAESWGLKPGAFIDVTAICLRPANWYVPKNHYGSGVAFILAGAKDSNHKFAGNAIFPETLKSEFHAIRSTIEAYSKGATIGGYDNASACGVMIDKGVISAVFEVTSEGIAARYNIDRLD